MPARLELIRGHVLAPDPTRRQIVRWPDALIRVDERGRVRDLSPATSVCEVPETWPGAVILPGFVDCHLHFPQTRITGSASGPLLPWLERSVFPEEARFAEAAHAAAVAGEFCDALLAQGTTSAGIFSSSHPVAADALLTALDHRGLRAVTGVTLMDRQAPPEVLLDVDPALAALDRLRARWHGHDDGRLRISVIPRFAISCTPELLRRAGAFAERHGLLVQTHISENLDEIRLTAELYPQSRDYLGVYEDHGLAGPRAILGHAIHLEEDAWARVAADDMAVAHCPDSNFF
ncbi:MAG: amidohydrolase family protein, partial [Myxococcales bacterium]|nr:amidohydrolase family protein [Myxococcales bacterium]